MHDLSPIVRRVDRLVSTLDEATQRGCRRLHTVVRFFDAPRADFTPPAPESDICECGAVLENHSVVFRPV
jgi:hypothetical protein